MGWPPAWAGLAINLRGWLWFGWWFLVLKLKLQCVEMLTLSFSCLHKINSDRSWSSVTDFPKRPLWIKTSPQGCVELQGWIISLAWLVPSFVCLPELSAPSAPPVAKVKAEVSLSTQDLLCAAKITYSMGINFLENLQIDSNYSRFLCSLFIFFLSLNCQFACGIILYLPSKTC